MQSHATVATNPQLIDYFFVCGLLKNQPCEFHQQPCKDAEISSLRLKAEILERFPENRPHSPWDHRKNDTVKAFCHPGGIEARIGENLENVAPQFHSFPLTDDCAFRKYVHVLIFYEPMPPGENRDAVQAILQQDEGSEKKAYSQKSVCIITKLPFIDTCHKILKLLYQTFVTAEVKEESLRSNLPIESYIFNLLYELPLPPPNGSSSLKWVDASNNIVVNRPALTELPLLDVPLSLTFTTLQTAENVISLLTSALLEHQIILLSEDSYKLVAVAEGIMALMFPFTFVTTYAIMPSDCKGFIDSPVPYVYGFKLNDAERQDTEFNNPGIDQCIVDLDDGTINYPEDQPLFPMKNQLCSRLSAIVTLYQSEIASQTADPNTQRQNSLEIGTFDLAGDHMTLLSNATVAKVTDIAKRVGVISDDSLHSSSSVQPASPIGSRAKTLNSKEFYMEIAEQKFNTKIREEVFRSFITLFLQYDKFVIHPARNDDDHNVNIYSSSRNFDKASFLAEQQHSSHRFLSSFMETQSFVSFIDDRIILQSNPRETVRSHVSLFNKRIEEATNWSQLNVSMHVDPSVPTRSFSVHSGQTLAKCIEKWKSTSIKSYEERAINPIICCSSPHALSQPPEDEDESIIPGVFPTMRKLSLLSNHQTIHSVAPQRVFNSTLDTTQRAVNRQQSIPEFSPDQIAQNNWRSLEQFLKDVKLMVKRLLVSKMGKEAHALGHSNMDGLEENTLIGKLCDLFERVWMHGLHTKTKRAKSSLWSHLLQYEEKQKQLESKAPMNPGAVLQLRESQQYSWSSLPRRRSNVKLSPQMHKKYADDQLVDHKQLATAASDDYIPPPDNTMLSNIRCIQNLSEAQTDAGKCRAWVRLLLEQKQLYKHIDTLISDQPLLRRLYKLYSLLQCDQREQFLYHIMTLSTVDFMCFTNSFRKTEMLYRVWVFPRKQFGGFTQTTANVCISMYGEFAETGNFIVSKGCREFSFKHQNIGALSALTIGHDNAGMSAKWFVEFVIVRNETTGQAYNFPCCRWLGKSADDGSLQRLLIAESIPQETDLNQFVAAHYSVRKRSMFGSTEEMFGSLPRNSSSGISLQSLGRSGSIPQLSYRVPDLQENIGKAVNAIVKVLVHENSHNTNICLNNLTRLLMGPDGLVPVIHNIFTHGLKSGGGLFKKRLFAWDVISTVCEAWSNRDAPPPKPVNQGTSLASVAIKSLNELLLNPTNVQNQHELSRGGDWILGDRRGSQVSSSRYEDANIYTMPFDNKEQEDAFAHLVSMSIRIARSHGDGYLGRDDMFMLLICKGVQNKLVAQWISQIATIPQISQLYEEYAFMRDLSAVQLACQLLNNLSSYNIPLSKPLYRGMQSILK